MQRTYDFDKFLIKDYYSDENGLMCLYVYESNLKVAVRAAKLSYYPCDGKMVLNSIRVENKYQNQGFGTALLKQLETRTRELKLSKITGIFGPDDELQGMLFYTKNGYTIAEDGWCDRISKDLDENE